MFSVDMNARFPLAIHFVNASPRAMFHANLLKCGEVAAPPPFIPCNFPAAASCIVFDAVADVRSIFPRDAKPV
ncbi:MAG: hypothetical protein ACT6QU_08245, partial [Aliihoeflea sp.]